MHIIPATALEAFRVAEEMRECDRQEIRATSGDSPGVALLRSMQDSVMKFACVDANGVPFAIFGAGEIEPGLGSPWMLATDRLYDNRAWFLRATKPVVAAMHKHYPRLLNFVDARNTASIEWLRWAGFTIHDPVAYGVMGFPFHPFSKVHHV